MKSIFEWHALQDGFARLLEKMRLSVWLVIFHPIRKLLTSALPARQKSTASQATASYTPNVASNRCGKHHILRVPARAICVPRKDLRVLVPYTGYRNAPRVH